MPGSGSYDISSLGGTHAVTGVVLQIMFIFLVRVRDNETRASIL
jgi:hypothetical protein